MRQEHGRKPTAEAALGSNPLLDHVQSLFVADYGGSAPLFVTLEGSFYVELGPNGNGRVFVMRAPDNFQSSWRSCILEPDGAVTSNRLDDAFPEPAQFLLKLSSKDRASRDNNLGQVDQFTDRALLHFEELHLAEFDVDLARFLQMSIQSLNTCPTESQYYKEAISHPVLALGVKQYILSNGPSLLQIRNNTQDESLGHPHMDKLYRICVDILANPEAYGFDLKKVDELYPVLKTDILAKAAILGKNNIAACSEMADSIFANTIALAINDLDNYEDVCRWLNIEFKLPTGTKLHYFDRRSSQHSVSGLLELAAMFKTHEE